MATNTNDAANSFLPDPPTKTLRRYVVLGLIFTGLLLVLTYAFRTPRDENNFPYIADQMWGLPAAAVLATIAVAMVVLDIPLQRESAVHSHSTNVYSSSEIQYRAQQTEQHTAEQLQLNKAILDATGVVAVICAATSILMLIGPDGAPAGGRLIEVMVTAGAHLIVAAVCSNGLAYKAETFLKRSLFEDFKDHFSKSAWFAEWGLGPKDLAAPTPKSWFRTLTVHLIIALSLLGLFTVIVWLLGDDDIASTLILYAPPTVISIIVFLLSLWFSTEISLDGGIDQRMRAQRNYRKVHWSFIFIFSVLLLLQLLISLMVLVALPDVNFGLILSFMAFLLLTYSCFTIFVECKFIREFHFDPRKNYRWPARFSTVYLRHRLRRKLISGLKRSEEYIARHEINDSVDPPATRDEHVVMRDYRPEHYAFRFPNEFVNQIWSGRIPPLVGREVHLETRGRCGGMAFASLDFYHQATHVPTARTQGFAPARVPPDGHPFADYIFTRQLHSILNSWRGVVNGIRFLHLSGLTAQRLVEKSLSEERKTMQALDRGEPVVLGLIKSTSRGFRTQGVNHQVVCYGYHTNESGLLEFSVYDPNEPYDDLATEPYMVVLRRTGHSEDSDFAYELLRPGRIERWRGFFVQHYRPHAPDPRLLTT